MGRRKIGVGVALSAIALGAAWFVTGDELASWRGDGAEMVSHDPLPPLDAERIAVPSGGLITCQGDSLTKGSHGGRTVAGIPYPDVLAEGIGHGVETRRRGVGGHRAHDGIRRWGDPEPAALAIVMYGTNDAALRGMMGRFRPVPLPRFKTNLATIVRRHRAVGTPVLLLAPPPTGTLAMERRLAPYRRAVRDVAQEEGVSFLDPAPAFDGVAVPLQSDALHFTAAANRALGKWLAKQIVVKPSSDITP